MDGNNKVITHEGREMSHTPGNWIVSGTSIVTDDDRYCICVIEDDGGYEAPGEQQKANARLISASPQLLEALQWLVERLENPATVSESEATAVMTEALEKSRAAISKAIGQFKDPQAMGQCPVREGNWLYREDAGRLWRAVQVSGDQCSAAWIASGSPHVQIGTGSVESLSGEWRRPTDEEWAQATSDHSWRLLD